MNVFAIEASVRGEVDGKDTLWNEIEWSVQGGIPRIGEVLWIHEGDETYCFQVEGVSWSDTGPPHLDLVVDPLWGEVPKWMKEPELVG